MSLTGKDLVALYKKQPVGITCGLVSVGLLAFMFAVRSGAQEEAEKLRDEKRAEADRLANNIKYGKNLDAETATLAALNKEVLSRAIRPSDKPLNSQYFLKLADEAGVRSLGIPAQLGVLQKAAAKTNYAPIAYKITVQGEFPQITDYLRRVEHGGRFARVTDIKLRPSAREGPDASKLTLVLSLDLIGLPPAP